MRVLQAVRSPKKFTTTGRTLLYQSLLSNKLESIILFNEK
ncbi:hypothetical protein EDC49_0669 [Frederiksenia canicola]|uniref:Uncharacterized protein n=1 Tax=Frederiksenia canicola TaxID=123824 RepID=A0ABX9XSW7_9PAST|nr:hypothetical protein EDC49_0669 [Frederiksenia canicola]